MLKPVSGGGQKGGMIDDNEDISLLESIALIMSFANITEEAVKRASEIMNKVLAMSVHIVNIISNNEGCLENYLKMVLGNTLIHLFEGALFIEFLIHAQTMLPQLFIQLINLIGAIAPYLLTSSSFLAQGIIGSIALTMVNYYINIAGQGLKEAGDQAENLSTSFKKVIDMPAEQVIKNAEEAIQYIQSNQEKMKDAIKEEQKKKQQKITIDLRLRIIYALMRKLENEKADLIKEGNEDGTEFEELEEKYKKLKGERDSLEEELNNEQEAEAGEKEAAADNMNVADEEEGAKAQKIEAPAADNMDEQKNNLGGGTRKKRTSRKGKKKASKNRKTKARRARKSRKTKK